MDRGIVFARPTADGPYERNKPAIAGVGRYRRAWQEQKVISKCGVLARRRCAMNLARPCRPTQNPPFQPQLRVRGDSYRPWSFCVSRDYMRGKLSALAEPNYGCQLSWNPTSARRVCNTHKLNPFAPFEVLCQISKVVPARDPAIRFQVVDPFLKLVRLP